MRHVKLATPIFCIGFVAGIHLYGQRANTTNPTPDALIFTTGERLIGQLESATGSSVVFKSSAAGEVTVDWNKVRELRSAREFAVIRKGVKLRYASDARAVPQGTIAVNNQQVVVQRANGSSQTIPVGDVAEVVEEGLFQSAFHRAGFGHGWKGGATAGLSLTEATQTNRTFTAALNMVRTVPQQNWLDTRSRTIFDVNESYGNLKSPATPAVKTSLFHLDAEQDWYLSPRLFAFVSAAFDHSFSQGLQLQQTYGGGLGFVVFKQPNQELDVKISADYIDQRFEVSTLNKHLVGSIFGETYTHTFAHGILLNEQGEYIPAWNDTSAYSALASAGLTFPVYRHFGLTLGALDNFLNDPPPGFKKNSFQFTAGATYSF